MNEAPRGNYCFSPNARSWHNFTPLGRTSWLQCEELNTTVKSTMCNVQCCYVQCCKMHYFTPLGRTSWLQCEELNTMAKSTMCNVQCCKMHNFTSLGLQSCAMLPYALHNLITFGLGNRNVQPTEVNNVQCYKMHNVIPWSAELAAM